MEFLGKEEFSVELALSNERWGSSCSAFIRRNKSLKNVSLNLRVKELMSVAFFVKMTKNSSLSQKTWSTLQKHLVVGVSQSLRYWALRQDSNWIWAQYCAGNDCLQVAYCKFRVEKAHWYAWSEWQRQDYVEIFHGYKPLSDHFRKPRNIGSKPGF